MLFHYAQRLPDAALGVFDRGHGLLTLALGIALMLGGMLCSQTRHPRRAGLVLAPSAAALAISASNWIRPNRFQISPGEWIWHSQVAFGLVFVVLASLGATAAGVAVLVSDIRQPGVGRRGRRSVRRQG